MINADKLIVIGRIGAPYGVQGWVKIHSFTEPKQNIINYLPWLVNINGHWQNAELSGCRPHGEHVVANFASYHDRTAVTDLCHREIGVYRKQLPALAQDDYYWDDLEGLTVINQEDVTLGVMVHMMGTGANDVMVIKGEKEHLIPFMINEFVTEVDLEHKRITVNWDPEFL